MKTQLGQHEVYVCEKCGKTDRTKWLIERCEKRHICEHEKINYNFTCEYYEGLDSLTLYKTCKNCEEDVGHIDIDIGNQETLAKIWELLF
jgi:hypothetical protein